MAELVNAVVLKAIFLGIESSSLSDDIYITLFGRTIPPAL
jgi:hypothetical protein